MQTRSTAFAVPDTPVSNPSPLEGPGELAPKAPPLALLIYSHFFAPSIGGVEATVFFLAKGLAELRDSRGASEFKVTLVTQTPAGDYLDDALPFRVVRQLDLFRLWRLIRTSDVVHIAGPAITPLCLALLSGKPVSVEHHGFQTICPNGQLLIEPGAAPCPGHFMAHRYSKCLRCNTPQGWFASAKLWLLTFVRRALCSRAAANITETQWLGGLLHLPCLIVIPRGFERGHPISHVFRQGNVPVIVFVGRLVTTKGVRLLLEAAKSLRDQHRRFELVVVGDGPERQALEQYTRDAQLPAVRFVGALSPARLEATLTEASAVVVPSLGGEVFGLVVAENMLRALPVVASDLGAFREVLGETGVLFRTGDAQDLARALVQVLDDHEFAASLGRLAQRRAHDLFNQSRMLQAHADLYRALWNPHNSDTASTGGP